MFSSLKNLKSVIKTPEIEFLCHEEDFGIIPAPYSSRKFMPDWYKSLPQKTIIEISDNRSFQEPTLKRCPPFLDALCVGWIIPLAADVQFKTNHDGSSVDYRWSFHKNMIERHFIDQITTNESPNPDLPKPPLKFINHWMVKTPPGYSALFIPPLNRPNDKFTCYAGLVDTDEYYEYINFPFFFNKTNFAGTLEAGTPLMQVIPIKRDNFIKKGVIKKIDDQFLNKMKTHRKRHSVHHSQYRDSIWNRK